MRTLKNIIRIQPLIIALAALPALAFFTEGRTSEAAASGAVACLPDSTDRNPSRTRQVDIMDQNLKMAIGSYQIPEGWQVSQRVAVGMNFESYAEYDIRITGPGGELIHTPNSTMYQTEQDREQPWRKVIAAHLQSELDQLTIGDFEPSEYLMSKETMKEYVKSALDVGSIVKLIEAPVSGRHNGREYRGVVRLMDMTASYTPSTGWMAVSYAICPTEKFPRMMQTIAEIDDSYEDNPAYQSHIRCIQQCRRGSNNYPDYQREVYEEVQKMYGQSCNRWEYVPQQSECDCLFPDKIYTDESSYDPIDPVEVDSLYYGQNDWTPIEGSTKY